MFFRCVLLLLYVFVAFILSLSLSASAVPRPPRFFDTKPGAFETSSHGVRVPRGSTLLDKELSVNHWIGGWHLRTVCFWDSVVFRCVQLFSDLFEAVKAPLTLPHSLPLHQSFHPIISCLRYLSHTKSTCLFHVVSLHIPML